MIQSNFLGLYNLVMWLSEFNNFGHIMWREIRKRLGCYYFWSFVGNVFHFSVYVPKPSPEIFYHLKNYLTIWPIWSRLFLIQKLIARIKVLLLYTEYTVISHNSFVIFHFIKHFSGYVSVLCCMRWYPLLER